MKKIKLYIYPAARPHNQDSDIYRDLVPLSADGIKKHCEVVSPEKAEYFYMGQTGDHQPMLKESDFKYFKDKLEKHIVDIEGDWWEREIPIWVRNAILTINGAKPQYKGLKMFVRPTFSRLLVRIKSHTPFHKTEFDRSLGFVGQPDPDMVRYKMLEACVPLKSRLKIRDKWLAKAHPDSIEAQEYLACMTQSTFALCPSGHGVDSARFFEACYFGAVPIVISSLIAVPFEDVYRSRSILRLTVR